MNEEKNEAEKNALPYGPEEADKQELSAAKAKTAVAENEASAPVGNAGAIRQVSFSSSGGDADEEGGKFFSVVFDWIELFVISLAIVVGVMTFLVRHSPVIGSSMEPTVKGKPTVAEEALTKQGDVMLISKLFYTPAQGDIVVINSPHNFKEPIIKRIIAVGGDTVELYFNEWKTVVNGVELDEPYLYTSYTENGMEKNPNVTDRIGQPMAVGSLDKDGDGYEKIEVPEGEIFVMGDHRNNSKDSRTLGCIDERYILGKVLLRIYPFDRFGVLS